MKLTSEGAARLGRHESRGFPVSDFDFKPEDFDGCFQNGKDHIVLTVEEAKDFLGWLHNSQWKHRTDLEYAEDWQRDWIRYLKERIEKSEEANETE